ncbi:MAG: MerR family transcriptional regulator [Chitinophagaceae bacterium]|nr:MerR family transcriptional regulator [Chitinophagaceae bacterium]
MIPEQLSLFGGPPKPPKVIRQEEPAPAAEDALPLVEATPAAHEMAAVLPEQPAAETTTEIQASTPIEDDPVPDKELVPAAGQLEQPTETLVAADAVPSMEAFALDADAAADLPDADPFASTAEAAEAEDWAAFEATWQQVAPDIPAEDVPMEAADAALLPEELPALTEEAPDWTAEDLSEEATTTLPAVVAPAAGAASPAIAFVEPDTADTVAAVVADQEPAAVLLTEAHGEGPQLPPDEILFKRQYYSMRETAGMFGISHSMLRYWENEFDVLQPRKNRKGDRYFRPIDIKNLHLIYNLLKVRKFTMDGAREYLRHHNKALDTFELVQKLEKLKTFLNELKATL